LAAAHTSRKNCTKINRDQSRQPANEIFCVKCPF